MATHGVAVNVCLNTWRIWCL